MSESGAAESAERRGSYFFLSYAHSAPLAGSPPEPIDQWVSTFFHDLSRAVQRCAPRGSRLQPGFFDQEIPLGSDWKASLARALETAEVFVPLFSAGYFMRSWSGREWECFEQRVTTAQIGDPMQRFVPVLWTPLPERQEANAPRGSRDR